MTPIIAVLGASGFVGSRLLEMFHLTGYATLRPVVRNYSSLARLARFDLDWRIADARDQVALAAALEGCDAVVNLVVANPDVIVKNATATYLAAQAAGVKRMVFMSSASVHGQAPAAGTDEASPLHTRHRFAYNNAKVRAERELARCRRRGSLELVILRPGIVFGPRSRWVTDLADQLLSDRAYLIDEGQGICNSIYVDNLIEAIQLALTVPSADGEVFLVGDRERVSWLDFTSPIATGLGIDLIRVARLSPPPFRRGRFETIEAVRVSRPVQAMLPIVPWPLKKAAKGAIRALSEPPNPSPWRLAEPPAPQVTEEMAELQSCRVQLPWLKAERQLGYQAKVSFAEGMQRSLGWLKFAGYPVA
ncbi:MAG: NAD(P)-dependent oxidoreductase [Prochlorococcaceae cyanobacterium]